MALGTDTSHTGQKRCRHMILRLEQHVEAPHQLAMDRSSRRKYLTLSGIRLGGPHCHRTGSLSSYSRIHGPTTAIIISMPLEPPPNIMAELITSASYLSPEKLVPRILFARFDNWKFLSWGERLRRRSCGSSRVHHIFN